MDIFTHSNKIFDYNTKFSKYHRLFDYVKTHGFWFCSNKEQGELAKEMEHFKILKDVNSIVPSCEKGNFFVVFETKNESELPASLYRHLIDGVPC